MTKIQLKRVYDKAASSDGFRILVDRLWPRGIKKENLEYDLWAKEVAPSAELRKWFHENPTQEWDEFKQKYLVELKSSQAAKELAETIKKHKTVTLIYALKNTEQNNAIVLKEYLESVI